ncbi:hypothetical protein PMAYCL1PPCAC_33104, partial [Pristionchus mayeri]
SVPMVRDRLADFQDDSGEVFEEVEMECIGNFEMRMEEALELVKNLSDVIDNLKEKQQQILSLPIVEPRHKDELESAILAIREKTNQLRPRVQELEDEMAMQMRNNASETQMRIKRNQVDMLRGKMKKILISFNDSQVEYKESIAKRVKRSLQAAGENMTEGEIDQMLESHSTQVFYREISPLSIAGKLALEDASARHNELLDLEKSLAILQEMFEDMHNMVQAQDQMVTKIEKDVEETVVHTEQAAKHIKQAVVYKHAATRKKILCIIMIIAIVIILIAALIV